MADYWTHYYLGTKILENMDIDEGCRKKFLLGCQGPDIFYYEKFAVETNPPNLGELMHNNLIKKSFETMFLYLKENNSYELKNYIFGLIIHYILDKNIHPYIDSKKNYDHKRLEANIDTYIINKYLNKSIFEMDSSDILNVKNSHKDIYLVYKNIGNYVYDSDIALKEFNKSINHFRFFHKVFNNKNKLIRIFIKRCILLFNKDMSKYFYLDINKITLPDDISIIDEILINSRDESIELIKKLEKYLCDKINIIQLMDGLKETNYSGL